MKRLIAALAILAIILSVCVAENFVTNKFEDETEKLVKNIKISRINKDSEICKNYINELQNKFESNEMFLGIFTNKDIIDDIERSIYRLEDYSISDDDAMFLSEVSVLETELKELKRISGLYFNSIF